MCEKIYKKPEKHSPVLFYAIINESSESSGAAGINYTQYLIRYSAA